MTIKTWGLLLALFIVSATIGYGCSSTSSSSAARQIGIPDPGITCGGGSCLN